MKRATAQRMTIDLPPLNIESVEVTLIGDAPLICHNWSRKAKQQMLDKQMKLPRQAKAAKVPEEDFAASLYPHPDGGYGFPAVGFKQAGVAACGQVEGISKVAARAAFHVVGGFVKIEGEPTMREDMVRIAMGVADIRYRAEFKQWRARLLIRYNASALSAAQIIHLLNVAGFGIGVGEWRPQRNGSYGLFHVATGEEART